MNIRHTIEYEASQRVKEEIVGARRFRGLQKDFWEHACPTCGIVRPDYCG